MKHTTLPYRLIEPPEQLQKARLDNIALVPASLLKEKAQWQAIANRLPTGSVLCIPQTQRQRTILESVARFLRSKGRQVIHYPLERITTAKKKSHRQVENLQLAL